MSTRAAVPAPPFSVHGTIRALRTPKLDDLLLSVKAALAVAISLAIGFSQNLDNPYWSALTIYVLLVQPGTGAFRSRALFRLAGTAMGGVTAVLLASTFGSNIGVLVTVLILAVVATYYPAKLDRTPAAYMWVSASLTICVIGVVHVEAPGSIFFFAATRVAESSLGILAILLVDSLILPRAATPDFLAKMTEWRRQAAELANVWLAPHAVHDAPSRWNSRESLCRLAGLLAPLDALFVQLPYDIVARPPRHSELRLLRMTIAHIIAHLASADLWLQADHQGRADVGSMDRDQAEVREWLLERLDYGSGAIEDHIVRGCRLRDRLSEASRDAAALEDVPDLLCSFARIRLSELVGHWCRLESLLQCVATTGSVPSELRGDGRHARPVRSVDYLLGAFDVAPLALALTAAAIAWYATAWSDGAYSLLFVYVSLGFVLGTSGALVSSTGICLWLAVAGMIALTYEVGILPRVTAFPVLIGVLTMIQLPLGAMMGMAPAAILVIANTFAFLGLQNAYVPDYDTTLHILFACLAAGLFSVASLHVCSFDRPSFVARRLIGSQRSEVVEMASARILPDEDRFVSLSIDRIAQYGVIAPGLPHDDPTGFEALLKAFLTAAALRCLRTHQNEVAAPTRDAIADLRRAIARRFSAEKTGPTPSLALVERVWTSLARESGNLAAAELCGSLASLRMTLAAEPIVADPRESAA
ncbi:FUSC family protein [Sphingomonas morindae]|uniref:FUSC family protein n=1 Tax=Sphingomonas morindae TaxID=1541170 RepID=A0ABY4XAY1_9SPHN|nr:FUSC family protein [Sphingomonas morindae]USI73896.1 FUSC family protein [Sphingomonas morindae]